MSRPNTHSPLFVLVGILVGPLLIGVGCTKIPNPYYVASGTDTLGDSGDSGDTSSSSDSGSDTSFDSTDTGTGTGTDTDTDCPVQSEGCLCASNGSCELGLICVDGLCVEDGSCAPVDADVQVSYVSTWVAEAADLQQLNCLLSVTGMGNSSTTIEIKACEGLAGGLTLDLSPPLFVPNFAEAAVEIRFEVVDTELYLLASIAIFKLLLVDGRSLDNVLVAQSPWVLSPAPSSCPLVMVMCGDEQRIGVDIDGEVIYDGNKAQFGQSADAWIDTAIDSCGEQRYLLAVVGI